MGREVHVTSHASVIGAYFETNRTDVMCFRCGQIGHMRSQCLTYKVRLCWHHIHARCTDPACSFAHGVDELRTPWKPRCVRVVKQGGKLVSIGCNSTTHTFRKCPLTQDVLFL